MIAALREGDQDTASLAYDPQEAAFIGGIINVTRRVFAVAQKAIPVVVQTARLATNFVGGGRAALSDPAIASQLNQLRDRSLLDMLEELRRGGSQGAGQAGFAGGNLGQLSTQELFEELRRRTSR